MGNAKAGYRWISGIFIFYIALGDSNWGEVNTKNTFHADDRVDFIPKYNLVKAHFDQ